MASMTKNYGLLLILTIIACHFTYTNVSVRPENGHLQFPFMIFMHVQVGPDSSCAGTLIDHRRILTAAHCLINVSLITVFLGTDNLLEGNPTRFEVNSSRFLIHEDFDESTFNNDIALIYLDNDVRIDDQITAVFLSSAPEKHDIISHDEGAIHVVLGWAFNDTDFSEKLLTKNVTILDINECYDEDKSSLSANKICAIGTGDVKPCLGDSGGPLLISENIQIGILSHGVEDCSGLAIFTRIENYLPWIQDHLLSPEDHLLPTEESSSWTQTMFLHSNYFLVFLSIRALLRTFF